MAYLCGVSGHSGNDAIASHAHHVRSCHIGYGFFSSDGNADTVLRGDPYGSYKSNVGRSQTATQQALCDPAACPETGLIRESEFAGHGWNRTPGFRTGWPSQER